MTFSAPMFVTAEFINNTTGEIKSQTVFMGDFPLMSAKGTFIINGTERVVVSQLVRSPGVYFDRQVDKTSDKDIYSCKVIPSRGAWLEFEIDKRDSVGVRIDRKRKQSVTVLLKALGWDDAKILDRFGGYESMRATLEKDHTAGQDEALLDIYRKLRPGEPPTRESAQALLENLYFNPKRYDLAKVGRYKVNRKLGLELPIRQGTLSEAEHRRHHRVPGPAARGRGGDDRRRDDHPARDRRHRPLRQPAAAHRGRADPEPGQARPGPDGARRQGADDDPGRRGDHAADPDQHPARGGVHQGVLRHQPALPVHGPDQPAGRPDPQAPPERAWPGRPEPGAGGLRGPRRAPQPLRPDVPDRDAGRAEHRPDRLAVQLRPGERVRLRRDAVPQGQQRHRDRPDRLPDRRRGGQARHRPGEHAAGRRRHHGREPRAGPPQGRRGGLHPAGRGRLHGRVRAADGVRGHRHDPVPRARRREPRADGLEHAAAERAAAAQRRAAGRHRHGVPRRDRRGRRDPGRQGRRGRGVLRGLRDGDERRRHPDHLPGVQVPPVQPGHLLQPEAGRRGRRPGGKGPGAGRRPVHRPRRDGARQEPARGVHAVGGPQLRGRDHPVPAPRSG